MLVGLHVFSLSGKVRLSKWYDPVEVDLDTVFRAGVAAVSRTPEGRDAHVGAVAKTEILDGEFVLVVQQFMTFLEVAVLRRERATPANVMLAGEALHVIVECLIVIFGGGVSDAQLVDKPEYLYHCVDQVILGGIVINTDVASAAAPTQLFAASRK